MENLPKRSIVSTSILTINYSQVIEYTSRFLSSPKIGDVNFRAAWLGVPFKGPLRVAFWAFKMVQLFPPGKSCPVYIAVENIMSLSPELTKL